MTILAGILQGDRADLELIQLALETLSNIMTFEENNPDGNSFLLSPPLLISFFSVEQPNLPQDITVQFTGRTSDQLFFLLSVTDSNVQNYLLKPKKMFMLHLI